MRKLLTLIFDYRYTYPIDINRFQFTYYYALTKISSYLRNILGFDNKLIAWLTKHPKSFLIRNNRGIFSVKAYDDSLTTCSNYYEEKSLSYLSTPAIKDLFIDIGANRGVYSITAVKKYGYNQAIACEPNPNTLKTLRENIILNNLETKVKVVASGISDVNSKANLEYDPCHTGGATIMKDGSESLFSTRHKVAQINIQTLDSILTLDEKRRVSFIKIDVEGHEMRVLEGSLNTLTLMSKGGVLLIESAEHQHILSKIEQFGFKYYKSVEVNHLFIKGTHAYS